MVIFLRVNVNTGSELHLNLGNVIWYQIISDDEIEVKLVDGSSSKILRSPEVEQKLINPQGNQKAPTGNAFKALNGIR